MNLSTTITTASLAAAITSTSLAEITGFFFVNYQAAASDFDGSSVTVNVQDMYMSSNDAADVLLNVFNFTMAPWADDVTFFQSFTGTGWRPTNLGGPFDTPALQQIDSFVTIGGFAADALQVPGAGAGTGLDPNFGGNTADRPGDLAGWYNGSPPLLNGAAQDNDNGQSLSVLVGRFSSIELFDLNGSTASVTWNQGLGTSAQQADFILVPAPGILASLNLIVLLARRRRR